MKLSAIPPNRARALLRSHYSCFGVILSLLSRIRQLASLAVVTLESAALLCLAQTDVLTYRNDNQRTAQNLSETILTPANVQSATFGLLFNYPTDGLVDAQPLVVSGMTIGNMQGRNVVFTATENDSVYSFDAVTGATYWKVSVLGPGKLPPTTADVARSRRRSGLLRRR